VLFGHNYVDSKAGGGMPTSNNFTLVRLTLAILVLFSHSYALVGRIEPMFLSRSLGNFAVHCFFAISGYLIAGSFISSASISNFILKRSLRILPALIVAYYFSKLAIYYCGGYVTNPVPHLSNGSLWTLSWESLMYTGIAVAGALQMLRPGPLAALYSSALLLFFVHMQEKSPAVQVIAPLALLFLGGAFLRVHNDALNIQRYGTVALISLFVLFAPGVSEYIYAALKLIPFAWGPNVSYPYVRLIAYLIALPVAMIFLCQYFFVSLPFKNDYSYGLYVFAWPIQQCIVYGANQYGYSLGPKSLFLTSGALTMLAAVACWHLLEQPAMRLKNVRLRQLLPQSFPCSSVRIPATPALSAGSAENGSTNSVGSGIHATSRTMTDFG
jgi:peptidoglycan/LPS O-acetylase OafA/YrhL